MQEINRTFRKATVADRDRILEIYEHIFDAEERGPVICGWRRGFYPTPEVCDAHIASGEMVVQEIDGVIVGSAKFDKLQDDTLRRATWDYDVPDEEVLVLHTLTVDPLCSGQGGGKAFLQYYEELAKEMGCSVLRMDTGGTNTRARKIYADCGFKEVCEIPFEIPEPGKSQFMVIFLEKHVS